MTSAQRLLIAFAEHTLTRLEHDLDWGCDTFDSIAACAQNLGLADFNTNQAFRRCTPPQTLPVARQPRLT